MIRPFWLWLAAVICFLLALFIALGANLFGSSFDEWLAGGLLASALAGGFGSWPGPA